MRAITLAALLALTGCVTDVELGTNTTPLAAPTPTKIDVGGSFCAPVVTSPVKLIIALDATQSMSVTDPNGTRASAVVSLLDSLPQDPSMSVAVMLFRDTSTSWLTRSGNAEFDAITDLTAADRTLLAQRILNFTSPGSDATDFVTPLSNIYQLLVRDMSQHVGADETRARYAVIFVSDGAPTVNQDDQLVCGDAVARIAALSDLADEVRFHTVHVFQPPLSACAADAGVIMDPACGFAQLPMGTCPKTIVDQNARRLERMAELGGGTFHDFRDNTPVTFELTLAPIQRRLMLDQLVVSNLSAPARSPLGLADSDGDSLLDADELLEGTLQQGADTDADGFSDGAEVYIRSRGGHFDPLFIDPGCPAQMQGLDTDCDGLFDCDEQLLGTSSQLLDSDNDGIPDAVEFKLGSQPTWKDLTGDPDGDTLKTGAELVAHLDPQQPDSNPTNDYRYAVTRRPALELDGSQCWDFTVSNITLANTLTGVNEFFVSYSMVWADRPAGRSFARGHRQSTTGNLTTIAAADFGQCR
ncbi:MAG: VWA domain-containing protein [Archangium sp.]